MKCILRITEDKNGILANKEETLAFTSESSLSRAVEMNVLNLYPQVTLQTIDGFGGAMTESAAYALSLMSEEDRKSAIHAYFGEDGIGYRFIRTHIDSCDFSLDQYSAVSDPEADPNFTSFTLERDKRYIIPAIKEAMTVSKEPLAVLLSPWSPPAAWKTDPYWAVVSEKAPEHIRRNMPKVKPIGGTRSWGGHLKPEHYADWAKYIVKYISAYLEEGIPVTMVTIQNESLAATPWDSCQWTIDEQKVFLKDFLYPEMAKASLDKRVGIYIWDHNKERVFEWAGMIDDITHTMIEGVAFHWYSGDHFEAVQLTRDAYPDKKLYFTEGCVEYGVLGGNSELSFGQKYAHDIIGNFNAGMNAFIDWNLYLDDKGGPNHVQNYCGAPMMLNKSNKPEKHTSYFYLEHFSRYIKPGAKRIGFSRFTERLEMTAFKNPDDSLVLIMLNRTANDIPVNIRLANQVASWIIPGNSITTGIIE